MDTKHKLSEGGIYEYKRARLQRQRHCGALTSVDRGHGTKGRHNDRDGDDDVDEDKLYIYIYVSVCVCLCICTLHRRRHKRIHASMHAAIHPSSHPSIQQSINFMPACCLPTYYFMYMHACVQHKLFCAIVKHNIAHGMTPLQDTPPYIILHSVILALYLC